MATASATTRSLELGNFLSYAKRPRTGGLWRRHCGLCRGQFRRGKRFRPRRLWPWNSVARQRRPLQAGTGPNERRFRVEAGAPHL